IKVTGAFSHFSDCTDTSVTVSQYELFMNGVCQLSSSGISLERIHISSSAGYEMYSHYNLSAVRLGRILYMDSPSGGSGTITEVASFRSYITNIRQLKIGDSLSYGNKYSCDRDSTIATVGVGYGDGLKEELVMKHAPVLVKGERARLMGCCMDQCQIDITDISCMIGDEVTFFGRDESGNLLSSQKIAALIGDNEGCGLTSALTSRVERIYI
ncbi:MAG: alanine racemase, partial [Oscillospiraceae bacterium]|nr:alanine racemase [Oscillospiraceae bacterium]